MAAGRLWLSGPAAGSHVTIPCEEADSQVTSTGFPEVMGAAEIASVYKALKRLMLAKGISL